MFYPIHIKEAEEYVVEAMQYKKIIEMLILPYREIEYYNINVAIISLHEYSYTALVGEFAIARCFS